MRYYKQIKDEYILLIGIGTGNVEITKEEYEDIQNIIKNKPIKEGYDYKLKIDLTWEEFEIEQVEETPTDEDYIECAKILLGVE